MSEPDLSILDELAARNRRAALRQRGAATGRVRTGISDSGPRSEGHATRTVLASSPRPLGRRRPKPKPRPRVQGPGVNSETAKANARASIEARRRREGDLICDAVLGILQRLSK